MTRLSKKQPTPTNPSPHVRGIGPKIPLDTSHFFWHPTYATPSLERKHTECTHDFVHIVLAPSFLSREDKWQCCKCGYKLVFRALTPYEKHPNRWEPPRRPLSNRAFTFIRPSALKALKVHKPRKAGQ